MTLVWNAFQGGETRDPLSDGWTDNNHNFMKTSDDAGVKTYIVTAPVITGSGAIKIGVPGWYGNTGALLSAPAGKVVVIEAWLCLDGPPPAAFLLLGDRFWPAIDLYCGANRRLQLRKPTGAVSPWSRTPLATDAATLKHVVWIIDPLTLGTAHVLHYLLIDSVLQWAVDAGPEPIYDSIYQVRVNSDGHVSIYADDVCAAYSTDPADAPHLARVPIGRVAAQHPAGAGINAAWGLFPNAGESAHQDWDDPTGNDGDSTYLFAGIPNKLHDSAMQSADALGWAAGAAILRSPAYTIIHRTVSGSKFNGQTLCSLAAPEIISGPDTAYVAWGAALPRSAGSWARADLGTLTVGAQTGITNHDKEWRVTALMMQWLYAEAYLPLLPAGRAGRRYAPLGYSQVV